MEESGSDDADSNNADSDNAELDDEKVGLEAEFEKAYDKNPTGPAAKGWLRKLIDLAWKRNIARGPNMQFYDHEAMDRVRDHDAIWHGGGGQPYGH